MDADWIEHRREDGERLGWIRMVGENFIAVDVLGREVTGAVDWLEAEEALDQRGLAFLAERWQFDSPARGTISVRIVEVSTRGIRDRKSTRLNSSHVAISYAVFCLKKNR